MLSTQRQYELETKRRNDIFTNFKNVLPSDTSLELEYDEDRERYVIYNTVPYKSEVYITYDGAVLESNRFKKHILEIDDIFRNGYDDEWNVIELFWDVGEHYRESCAFYASENFPFNRKIAYFVKAKFAHKGDNCVCETQNVQGDLYGLYNPHKAMQRLVDWDKLNEEYDREYRKPLEQNARVR